MSMQPWAKLARVTLAGALLASAIGVSGAPLVGAQEEGLSPTFPAPYPR